MVLKVRFLLKVLFDVHALYGSFSFEGTLHCLFSVIRVYSNVVYIVAGGVK